MRILHYGLSTNKGGIETYLFKLFTHIGQDEFHFDFIDTNISNPCFYKEFSEMGSKFFKITPRNVSFYKNRKELNILFKNEKFDILHCHLNTLSYVEPIYCALKNGCSVVVHSRSSGIPNSIVTKILHYFNFIFFPRNKVKMIAVSEKAGKWLFGKHANFQVINNGIDTEKYIFNINTREKMRKILDIKNKYVVGHIGAFLPVKNHKFLLKVFDELLKINNDSLLLLIGSGPLIKDIKKQTNEMGLIDKVVFLGTRDDIPNLLSAMDCFLFPSFYEGFPNAILEAQTSGLPCLISDSITKEIIVMDNCKQLSLDLPPYVWAQEIQNLQYYDRNTAVDVIEKEGFSISEELNKIKSLYSIFD